MKFSKFNKVKKILATYHQEHLLYFYEELSDVEKEHLLSQICNIDFEQILNLYKNSKINSTIDKNDITPLEYIEKERISDDEKNRLISIGENVIINNSFAVVTMAGGQGTRLGYKGPKGTYELDFKPKKKSLFELIAEDLRRNNEKYNTIIPWYIMTSEENNLQTISFFEENNFFGYSKEKIKFFTQGKLPLISINGNLILQEPYLIKEAANGNGNVFFAMNEHGIIRDMKEKNVEWIYFGGIDNILQKNFDPLFVGLCISKQYKIGSKSIFKEKPLEKTAVYCRKYGKPAILDYEDIDISLSTQKYDDGLYKYRDANILSHIMNISAIEKICRADLPYHRAFKKNAFVNDEGVKQVPDKPNSFKFENFIFDAFSYFDDMLLLRVNSKEEFAPIKDFTGIYNPDTALEKYNNYMKNVISNN